MSTIDAITGACPPPTVGAPHVVEGGKRLLMVKFGAIGDVIMAVPAAALLRDQGYSVDWIAGEAVAPILRLYPWIHVLPVRESALLQGGAASRLKAVVSLWRQLRQQGRGRRYDLVATLYYDRRYLALTAAVGARRRINLSMGDRAGRLLPGRHHTDEYARILLGRKDGEMPTQLAPVPPPSLGASPRARVPGRPRVVLVPAGARNLLRDDALRRWPVEQYVALAETLIAHGCEVVLAGGPDDRWSSPHFASLAVAGPKLFADLIGSLSLVETLALLDSAEVTVTHDTGPLHLAGLTSTAIVTIFGPTDPHGRLPQRENCVALWGGEGFACRPCYDGRDYAPCAHNGCIRQVTPALVVEHVLGLLRARAEGRALPPRVLSPPHTSLVTVATPGGEVPAS